VVVHFGPINDKDSVKYLAPKNQKTKENKNGKSWCKA
jgi:hypothetical protein